MVTGKARHQAFHAFISCSMLLAVSALNTTGPACSQSSQYQYTDELARGATGFGFSLSKLDGEILAKLDKGDLPAAVSMVKSTLKKGSSDPRNLELLLAALERVQGNYTRAAKHLGKLLTDDKTQGKTSIVEQAHLYRRRADCFRSAHKFNEAFQNYSTALLVLGDAGNQESLRSDLLESIVGTLSDEGKYEKAVPYAVQLISLNEARTGSNTIDALGALFYSYLQAGTMYKKLERVAEARANRERAGQVFERLVQYRSSLEDNNVLPELHEYDRVMRGNYIASNRPSSLAEYLWLVSEFRLRTLPLIRWRPQQSIPSRAVILCIHGLGLENRAFTAFGRTMVQRGYTVYAMDVRGFGSWITTPGQENLAFSETIDDIGSIMHLMESSEPGQPVFVLGESMGGAIALRAGAKYPDRLKGVISSVPSYERFDQRKTAVSVALHFLRSPSRPVNMASMVTDRATSQSEFKDIWQSDAKAKLSLAPKELAKFDLFMRGTRLACHKIDKMPVFVIQGLKDRLVKPEGTFNMFAAVKSEDKNIFIIGKAEHLIFESIYQNVLVIDALDTWLKEHLAVPVK